MVADFDGDSKYDLTVWRAGTGYVRRSSDLVIEVAPWGSLQADESVAVGDYDGDGKAELAIRRAASAVWEILFR